MNLALIFLTGLTTGALSCLAVQGGLLASSVACQEELNIQAQIAAKGTKGRANKRRTGSVQMNSRSLQTGQQALALPIFLFLVAKVISYTILGFLLGWLGSIFRLTPFVQAIMQLAIGIFMVGTALRILNVHPFFRYFVIEPPAFVTRYIRRKAKGGTDRVSTPIFLGALTVLIPCGVTQVMMATAIAAGNPIQGAAILFAFTLGTSPLFFALAYLATQLGKQLERRFLQLVAATVFVLGMLSVNTALNLMGVPVLPSLIAARAVGEATSSIASSQQTSLPAGNGEKVAAGSEAGEHGNVITIQVLASAYEPNVATAPSRQPTQLKLVTSNTWGCTRAFVIPSLGIQKILPETGETLIDLPPQPAGSRLFYTCSMGMYNGAIQF